MKKIAISLFVLVLLAAAGRSADAVTVSIRFFEQKIYFLNDRIDVKITVKNDGVEPYRFLVADNRVFSVDFDVRTMTNRPAQYHSNFYQNLRNSMEPVLYREISLLPEEEYSLVVSFTDFIALREPGLYVIQALFYPNLFVAESASPITSNKLTLNVRPPISSPEERDFVEAQIERSLQREDLPPDGVVSYTLHARMNNQWNRFFLYINLEKLYVNSFLRTRAAQDQFNRLPEEEKLTRIAAYKRQIMKGEAEWQFVMLPDSFRIEETNYTRTEGTVRVRQIFRHPDYTEPRLYTYYLERTGNAWEIVNYIVEISGPGS
ncbi:MAG TPA: hypothetical protein ENN69_05885 [Spirochaetia bacterium]|nr:hypothetical protein [Spirochaetia bacterium]